jgi:hypothetical protein
MSTVSLTSGGTTVGFDAAKCEIVSLVATQAARDFAVPEKAVPLATLTLSQWHKGAPNGSATIHSSDFDAISCEATSTAVHAIFLSHDARWAGLRVKATCRVPEGGSLPAHLEDVVLCRFNVSGVPASWAVSSVLYPGLAQRHALDDPATDAMLFPRGGGVAIPVVPARGISESAIYPGTAPVQLAARYDSAGGMYLATYDGGGHVKQFSASTSAGASKPLQLDVSHLLPEVVGADVVLPYDVALGTFGRMGGASPWPSQRATSDWRCAAEKYRSFSSTQLWSARPLEQRPDVPRFLYEGAGLLITVIQDEQGFDPTSPYGARLEKLPAFSAAYRNLTGLTHLVHVPYGWENRGTWAGINYFPSRPSDADWSAASKQLRASGDHVVLLVSGFWWVIKRRVTRSGPAFDDSSQLAARMPMLIKSPNSTTLFTVDAFDAPTGPQAWRGLSAKLCHGSENANQVMAGVFARAVQALGASGVSFDQEIGGGQTVPCYDTSHGHPPGFGAWMAEGFARTCRRIRRATAANASFFLMSEQCSELTIPLLGSCWSRQFAPFDWTAGGATAVGLFSYLYHEYITAFAAAYIQGEGTFAHGGPGIGAQCLAMAYGLVRGMLPAPFSHQVPLPGTPGVPTSRLQVSNAFATYARAVASWPSFLALARTVPPPAVTTPTLESYIYEMRSGTAVRINVSFPAVVAGTFVHRSSGEVGTIAASVSAAPTEATLTFGSGANGSRTVVYDGNGTELERHDGVPVELKLSISAAWGVRMVIVSP